MEIKCYRKTLHISYKDYVINEEVCAKIQQATGLHKDLTILKRCKVMQYGHMDMSTIHQFWQSTVKGGRRQGRQKKRWEDSIKEWTDLEFV